MGSRSLSAMQSFARGFTTEAAACNLRAVLIRCPTCRRELQNADESYRHRPFCSKRCKTIDLARWLNEEYRIPSTTPIDGDFEEQLLLH